MAGNRRMNPKCLDLIGEAHDFMWLTVSLHFLIIELEILVANYGSYRQEIRPPSTEVEFCAGTKRSLRETPHPSSASLASFWKLIPEVSSSVLFSVVLRSANSLRSYSQNSLYRMNPDFDTEAFTLLGVGVGIIGFRIVSRLVTLGVRNLRVDDFLMLLAIALYAGQTVSAYYVGVFGKGLTNAAMTPEDRQALSNIPDSKEYKDRVGGSKAQILVWVVYTTLLWVLKTCMLFFYARLTENVDRMRQRVQIGYVLLPVIYTILLCVELFGCHPFQKHWQIYPDPGEICYPSHSTPNLYTMIVFNATTDLYLLLIPLPMIWKSGLPTKVKLGLYVMFSGGVIVTTVAFLCCFFIITAGIGGAARAGQWSIRESFLATIITNIPLIFPFVAKFYHRLSSTLPSSTSKKESYHLSSPGISFGSLGKNKKAPNPYSIPGVSAWEKTVWDRTVNGEQDWHSQTDLWIPNNKTDIETGSVTCAARAAIEDSEKKNVVAVATETGVSSDVGLPLRSKMLASPKKAALAL